MKETKFRTKLTEDDATVTDLDIQDSTAQVDVIAHDTCAFKQENRMEMFPNRELHGRSRTNNRADDKIT